MWFKLRWRWADNRMATKRFILIFTLWRFKCRRDKNYWKLIQAKQYIFAFISISTIVGWPNKTSILTIITINTIIELTADLIRKSLALHHHKLCLPINCARIDDNNPNFPAVIRNLDKGSLLWMENGYFICFYVL